MSKWEKLREKILSGHSDANIRFDEMCALLQREGYALHISGSHHVFQKPNWPALNLQPRGSHVKPYQVKQVRTAFIEKGHSA